MNLRQEWFGNRKKMYFAIADTEKLANQALQWN